ncbi:unnamed protein product [Effrenium voratum]|nr:unnamed protein product [Effrenium voratum]
MEPEDWQSRWDERTSRYPPSPPRSVHLREGSEDRRRDLHDVRDVRDFRSRGARRRGDRSRDSRDSRGRSDRMEHARQRSDSPDYAGRVRRRISGTGRRSRPRRWQGEPPSADEGRGRVEPSAGPYAAAKPPRRVRTFDLEPPREAHVTAIAASACATSACATATAVTTATWATTATSTVTAMAQTMCATTTAAATVPSGPTLVLDQLVDEAASLRKTAVAEVMVFCLEQAAHAKELANQLAARCVALHYTPLGRLELACIFCISDILQNLSYSHRCPGATAYRSAFEELLPSVFHRMYCGLVALGEATGERSFTEMKLRRVLKAWRDAEVYPKIYLDGLEAAGFAGALQTEAMAQPLSKETRMKLEVYAALDPLALERRCRNRGLWSVSWNQIPPSKSMLLQRLRVFEDYWSVRSKSSGAAQPALPQVQDDLDGTPVEASQRAPRIS